MSRVLPSPLQVRARCETALWWLGVPLVASVVVALAWTRWAWLAAALLALWLGGILATARLHVGALAWEATDDAFVARSGWLVRTVRSVPWSRVRSVELAEGIVDARLGLAALVVKAPGLGISVQGLAPEAARALRDELLARSAPDAPRPAEAVASRSGEGGVSRPVEAAPESAEVPDDAAAADVPEATDEHMPDEPAAGAAADAAVTEAPDGPGPDLAWFRAHPLGGLAESLSVLLALAGIGAYLALKEAEEVGGVLGPLTRTVTDPRWVTAGLAVVVLLAAWSEVSRRRTSWALDGRVLHERYAGRARTRTSVRLERIDGVDLTASVGARLLGLARLTVRVADGDDPMVVGHLRRAAAEALRERLVGRGGAGGGGAGAGGVGGDDARADGDGDGDGDAGRGPSRDLLARTDRRTVVRAFVVRDPVAPALVGALVATVVALAVPALREGLFLAAGALAFAGRGVWRALESGTGRTVERVGADLHVASGLATRTESTVRAGRVHAVRISTRPQWWGADLWSVTVLTGSDDGSEDADDDELTGALLPADGAAVALDVAQAALPALARVDRRLLADLWPGGRGVVRPDPAVDGAPVSVLRVPAHAWWLAPLTWRVRTAALAADGLLVRTGRLAPRVTFVPLHRVQGVALEQGPLERRAGVVSVAVHLVDGPVACDVGPFEPAAARHLADVLAAAARRDVRGRGMSEVDGRLSA